ncbi:MAG: hypothetical protein V4631_19085 [Pseudomonadota bacterium]
MSPELELLLKVVGGIAILVLPIVILGFFGHYFSMLAAGRVGRAYCATNSCEFVGIEIKKAHYTLKFHSAGKTTRRNFRMAHLFGVVFKVEWL